MPKLEPVTDATFADRLRTARERRGLSQRKFAKLCDMSQAAVWRYENSERRPDLYSLVILADVLKVSTDYLCGRPVRKRPAAVLRTLRMLDELTPDYLNRAELAVLQLLRECDDERWPDIWNSAVEWAKRKNEEAE